MLATVRGDRGPRCGCGEGSALELGVPSPACTFSELPDSSAGRHTDGCCRRGGCWLAQEGLLLKTWLAADCRGLPVSPAAVFVQVHAACSSAVGLLSDS